MTMNRTAVNTMFIPALTLGMVFLAVLSLVGCDKRSQQEIDKAVQRAKEQAAREAKEAARKAVDETVDGVKEKVKKAVDDVTGGGLADHAIAWAEAEKQIGSNQWEGMCYSFVRQAFKQGAGLSDDKLPPAGWFGTKLGYAVDVADHFRAQGQLKVDGVPPRGAVVFYGSNIAVYGKTYKAGHAAISLGGGKIIHALGKVQISPNYLSLPNSNAAAAYLGYVTRHLDP